MYPTRRKEIYENTLPDLIITFEEIICYFTEREKQYHGGLKMHGNFKYQPKPTFTILGMDLSMINEK